MEPVRFPTFTAALPSALAARNAHAHVGEPR